ncbi:MAG: flavodoxin [Acidobacteriota bacterium]
MTARIAIVYGSTSGNTQEAAERMAELMDDVKPEALDVASTTVEQMLDYDVLLIGAPTWDVGELQYDWDDRFPDLDGNDFTGKKVAFFGAGDPVGYPDNFLDALSILWEKFKELGAELVGKWPTEGYPFETSLALLDGGTHFVGLGIDNDNASDLTEDRIQGWITQLRTELSL